MKPEAEQLYKRLYISHLDLSDASSFIGFIIKKGWHYDPWEKRGSIYVQQSAFTSAAIIFYSRPFTQSRGLPRFPDSLLRYDEADMRLHNKVLSLRHQVYAHSDASRYEIRPFRIGGVGSPTAIVGAPFFKLTTEESQQLLGMIERTQEAITQELNALLPVDAAKRAKPRQRQVNDHR